jgi:hypothetical protein
MNMHRLPGSTYDRLGGPFVLAERSYDLFDVQYFVDCQHVNVRRHASSYMYAHILEICIFSGKWGKPFLSLRVRTLLHASHRLQTDAARVVRTPAAGVT